MIAALLFLAAQASACWECTGDKADCEKRIEESRVNTVGSLRTQYASFCAGQGAATNRGFGLSTAGSFALRCDGKGGGCLQWQNDDMGEARNQSFPLNGGSCDEIQITVQAGAAPPAASTPRVDSEGREISLLE